MTLAAFEDIAPIDEYETTAAPFLADILGLDWHDCILTDDTTLADFSGKGLPNDLKEQARSDDELYDIWDRWVLTRIQDMFGIAPDTTDVRLVEIFAALEAAYGGRSY